ncbi:MAG: extracellular solute-binding protein [Bdellovibrio sp.]
MKTQYRYSYLLLLFLFITSVARGQQKLWVYTSTYKEYSSKLKKAFEAKHPGIEVQIFQAGSEKIITKVEAEFFAKRPVADVIMISDPTWASGLEKRDLLTKRSTEKLALEKNYYSVMVLITHKKFPKEKRPLKFLDLTKPTYKNLIQMGNPLESGTTFTAVSLLEKKYGWDFFKKLKDNEISANGGNSAVIQKVETGEKQIGIVLLENALAAQKRNSPIEIIYPQDGAIIIPSVQMTLKNSANKELASQFTDFVLSSEGQEILRSGYMYSVRKDVKEPEGAISFVELNKSAQILSEKQIDEIEAQAKSIKKNFSEIVLE